MVHARILGSLLRSMEILFSVFERSHLEGDARMCRPIIAASAKVGTTSGAQDAQKTLIQRSEPQAIGCKGLHKPDVVHRDTTSILQRVTTPTT